MKVKITKRDIKEIEHWLRLRRVYQETRCPFTYSRHLFRSKKCGLVFPERLSCIDNACACGYFCPCTTFSTELVIKRAKKFIKDWRDKD